MTKIVMMCNRCGQPHTYDGAQFMWARDAAEDSERDPEIEHYATLSGTCSCGQVMVVTLTCWEYPAGAENASDIDVTGADLIFNDCAACPDFSQ